MIYREIRYFPRASSKSMRFHLTLTVWLKYRRELGNRSCSSRFPDGSTNHTPSTYWPFQIVVMLHPRLNFISEPTKGQESPAVTLERSRWLKDARFKVPDTSTDPNPQPNPTRWKTFNCYCPISCGFKIQKHKHQIRALAGSSSLERDLGFQLTTSF